MPLLLLLLTAAIAYPFADLIDVFGYKWQVPIAADWAIEQDGSLPILKMLVARPQREPRRPTQFALAQTPDWRKVTVEAEVHRLGGSLIIVYAYRDPSHFNYAHLSVDDARKQSVHNGIFQVAGGDRVRISSLDGPASLPSAQEWYRVRLDYDSTNGAVIVLVNGRENPSLRAVDKSAGPGKVGIGSFFETAMFRRVRITGSH